MEGRPQPTLVFGCDRDLLAVLVVVCVALVIGFHTRDSIAAGIVLLPVGVIYLRLSERPNPSPANAPLDGRKRRLAKTDRGDAYVIRDDHYRPVATPLLRADDPAADLYPPMPE